MVKQIFLVISLVFVHFLSRGSHVMGGEITWKCVGGNYVFTLVFFRDCNGAEINTVSENLRVWNHPTITTIALNFVERIDISPSCTPVTGGPTALLCGTGTAGGNGLGASEKIVYQSAPLALPGIPPSNGWIFTYENFNRSNNITNISNPALYGITIAAKMYPIPGATSGCIDNSPIFLQEPYFVSCAGTPYTYNMNTVDPDLDSLFIGFGLPYTYFPTGIYDPPTNPAPLPFEPGFSHTSPTPDVTINPANSAAQINSQTGELSFTSLTVGNFVVKAAVQSYRNGTLIAEIEREMQLSVIGCTAANNPPIIAAPFPGGLFETTVNAGDLVTFNLAATDVEILQNGVPQTTTLLATGPLFGTNYTSATGCATPPCATLNTSPPIAGTQGVSTIFNWQTDCDHLVAANGNAVTQQPFQFVFKLQDDFCPVPKVSYATVTINVVNPGVIAAPPINCIQSDSVGDVTIKWTPVSNPAGTFVRYELYSVQSGLLATLTNLTADQWTHVGVSQKTDYFIAVISGCNGNATRYSDTISSIFLTLNNPMNGTAILQWNAPSVNPTPTMQGYYHIFREYPTDTWMFLDSVPFGLLFYRDTIDICSAFLRYKIVLENQPCAFISNSPGDYFQDLLTPNIPILTAASIDTLTNSIQLSWNQNAQTDTYGYVIYTFDANGFLVELDTAWGIGTTTYSYSPVINGPLSYSVAAFDSCYTSAVPPTFQTSGKASVHTTMFLSTSLDICDNQVRLNWTPYVGWNNAVSYQIWAKKNGENWQLMGSISDTSFTANVEALQNYCFFIQAISETNQVSFSNRACLAIIAPTTPDIHYLKVATVENNTVELRHLIATAGGVTAIAFEKMNKSGSFETLAVVPVTSNLVTYTDTDVDVHAYSYTYRARIVDSCGGFGLASNSAKTIHLDIQKDDIRLKAYLNWNSYSEFDGPVLGYAVYRGIDGIFPALPFTTVGNSVRSLEDDLNDVSFTGKVCYVIEAIEGNNRYNETERSKSNEACTVFEPLIYIPNAFMPEGINAVFKPVLTNFDPTNYRFTIFDRWGQVIFQTDSPIEGWSGIISSTGEMAPTGSYLYMVVMQDGNGIEIVKRGHVVLLK